MRAAIAFLCLPALAFAAPPKLLLVSAEKQPLAFSAPVGWEIHIEPVREKSMSVTVSLFRTGCGDMAIESPITIAIDQLNATPTALLDDQFPAAKPKRLHGWECVVSSDDVLCAGKLAGLAAVVTVNMSSTDQAPYKRLDPPELVSRIAASLAWRGKLDDLHEWRRAGTKDACK